jgi:hypothetical protein
MVAAKGDLDGQRAGSERNQVQSGDEILMRVGERRDDESADERGRQHAGDYARPTQRGAEGKFPSPGGARDERRGFGRVHAALAQAAHYPVADDQQKQQQDAVERLFQIACGQPAGSARRD